ncbi:MAG: N-acetylglucosamine-6-phosphate deacetylase [Elusimicrobia bacterium RIFOXYA2_FULL_39_19]|nr:MAG: N-acetylglucosamine-6-phosphate deacetylase [Elusimicrobia bacterium RIFOXYA2_FULL_39_19]
MNNVLIKNCRLYDAPSKPADILIQNGKIKKVTHLSLKVKESETKILNAGSRIITPGFIDVHLQGAGGADVLDATPEALKTIANTLVRFGTTSYLATTVYKPGKNNSHLAVAAKHTGKNLGGANLLGIHIEGPFISMEKKGMIMPFCICKPSIKVMQNIKALTGNTLKMMTIAPELKGSIEIIKKLVKTGCIASFGHSSAGYEDTLKGIKAGINHATHLFNAMYSIHHREPGPLVAIFENPKVSAQVITDGVHLHPAILKLAFSNMGEDRFITITDGMQAIGLPEGKYIYNNFEYIAKNGTARYANGTLVGTTLGQSELMARLIKYSGCTLEQAVKTLTLNPVKLLGIEKHKGSIAQGKDADLVVLNKDYSVFSTIINGEIVYEKK